MKETKLNIKMNLKQVKKRWASIVNGEKQTKD
jgi:hypothetical protein